MNNTVLSSPSSAALGESKKEPLAGAFFWVLAFFVVYCARPEDWIPGVAHLHLALVAGLFALIAFVMSLGRMKEGLPKEVFYLILLLAQLFLASIFSPVWKGNAVMQSVEFAKMVLIVMVITLAVASLARLRKLIFVQTASVIAVALISIKSGHLVNGRLFGALNGMYSNPNDLAIALVLSLPLCLVFLFRAKGILRKLVWTAAVLAMIFAIFRTGSRSGFIALVVAAFFCIWDFGIKGRRLYLPVLAVIVGMVAFVIAGSTVKQRLSETFSSNGPQESAYGSAVARRQLLVRSLEVTAEHPLFGVGPGDFQAISGHWQPTHNVYTALSAEGGIPALILFLMIYWRAFGNLRRVRSFEAADSEMGMFASAMRASLWAFAVAGPFFPDAYQYFVYFMFAFTTILCRLVDQKGAPQNKRSWAVAERSKMAAPAGVSVR
ncbi:MAG: O-antigen ligase family protein [Terriglobia bacterium]